MKIRKLNGKLNIIGKNIKKYRELKGLTLRELSEKLELYGLTIYHSDIHNIEHGKKTIRDYDIKGFCLALDVSLDDLYENTDKEYE